MAHVSQIVKNTINEDLSEITFYNTEGLIMHNLQMEAYPAEAAWGVISKFSSCAHEFHVIK